jgi:hypothetical protein
MTSPTKTSIETTLPGDNSLETQHFEIDPNGNVIVKNKALAEALSKNIKAGAHDPNITAVSVGVVVDF